MSELELFWDFSSPFAYLAATQITSLVERTGVRFVDRPVLLGGLFRAIGQVDVPLFQMSPAKQAHVRDDIHRWAEYYGVPFTFPSRFPVSSLKALRAYMALSQTTDDARVHASYRDRVFRAYWADDRDISDDAVLAEALGDHAAAVMPRMAEAAVKEALHAATNLAVERGVFGVPTYVIDGTQLFWGQDRMILVERALSRR